MHIGRDGVPCSDKEDIAGPLHQPDQSTLDEGACLRDLWMAVHLELLPDLVWLVWAPRVLADGADGKGKK